MGSDDEMKSVERRPKVMRVFSFGTLPRNLSSDSLGRSQSSTLSLSALAGAPYNAKGKLSGSGAKDTRDRNTTFLEVFCSFLVLVVLVPVLFTATRLTLGFISTSEELDESSVLSLCEYGDLDCILGSELFARHMELSKVTEVEGIVDRPYLSKADVKAARRIQEWMLEAGMNASIDAVGNIVGRYEADASISSPKTLVLGSHYDTISNAGKFDGVYGVLAAIAVVKSLDVTGQRLPFAIEVVAFDDEEGNNRFGTTNTGAKAFVGEYGTPEKVEALLEQYEGLESAIGTALKWKHVSADHSDIVNGIMESSAQLDEIAGYVELHIEQGPVLEAANRPIAVVEAIAGQTRMSVRVFGEAGHAGTIPMHMRKDALSAAAKAVNAIENIGSGTKHLVATVGTLNVIHGSTNAVPGEVVFTVDVRGPNNEGREDAVRRIIREIEGISGERGLDVEVEKLHEASAVTMDSGLQAGLREAIVGEGFAETDSDIISLPSGAGHDAMIIGEKVPAAMLFLRCDGGISHNPAEWLSPEDAKAGAQVLHRFVQDYKI